tara:strand:+ start:826 stop:948 length:123 start_codon:yes stop_codon:yes gene_type:complete
VGWLGFTNEMLTMISTYNVSEEIRDLEILDAKFPNQGIDR